MIKLLTVETDLSKFKTTCTYYAGPKWKIGTWYLINNFVFDSAIPWPNQFKIFLLRLFGATIGANVVIKPNVRIKHAWRLKIGDNSWLGEGTWIENLAEVELGKNVCISQNGMLLTGNHNYTASDFIYRLGKIKLEDGVWIGAYSVVCPGVVCQSHSVLTVNSVASKNMEPWKVYSGNPAISVRNRTMVF